MAEETLFNKSKRSERDRFSERFIDALNRAGYKSSSATSIWNEFSIRFAGSPVTVHAVRKWLVGESIPSQEKMTVLSEWLGVTPQWLRYGSGVAEQEPGRPMFDFPSASMIRDLQSLDAEYRIAAKEMIKVLVTLNTLSKS